MKRCEVNLQHQVLAPGRDVLLEGGLMEAEVLRDAYSESNYETSGR